MSRQDPRRGVSCLACGQALSRYTATCPNCGTPQPHKRVGSSIGLGVMLVLLLALLLYSLLSGAEGSVFHPG